MLIQCTYGPVSTEIMGTTYSFAPDGYGRCVAEVWPPRHIAALLAVSHYREVAAEPVPLVLTSIEPDTAELGSPDVLLICTGTGFYKDSAILFNGGVEATDYQSMTELRTTVKPSTASTAGSYPVEVRDIDGTKSNAVNFTFTEPENPVVEDMEEGDTEPMAESALTTDDETAPIPVTEISGIGPALETKLESAGITDVRQIAELTEEEATALDEQLGLGGRIARDDWIGQAKALVG
jgi:predicted flap endonuclease-1-like 5' DNA nuclease